LECAWKLLLVLLLVLVVVRLAVTAEFTTSGTLRPSTGQCSSRNRTPFPGRSEQLEEADSREVLVDDLAIVAIRAAAHFPLLHDLVEEIVDQVADIVRHPAADEQQIDHLVVPEVAPVLLDQIRQMVLRLVEPENGLFQVGKRQSFHHVADANDARDATVGIKDSCRITVVELDEHLTGLSIVEDLRASVFDALPELHTKRGVRREHDTRIDVEQIRRFLRGSRQHLDRRSTGALLAIDLCAVGDGRIFLALHREFGVAVEVSITDEKRRVGFRQAMVGADLETRHQATISVDPEGREGERIADHGRSRGERTVHVCILPFQRNMVKYHTFLAGNIAYYIDIVNITFSISTRALYFHHGCCWRTC
jgi:hypothetical protein